MKTQQSGFTIVELLVTIITAVLFVGVFYQLFVVLVTVNADARNAAQASNLAYSNMRRYPTVASTSLTCSGTSTYLKGSATPNLVTNNAYQELGPVDETVIASFPYGCTAIYDVVKLVSTVTYGKGLKISHATYIN